MKNKYKMWKNITLTFGFLVIWGWVGGFDWAVDTVECIKYNSNLIEQVHEANNVINNLTDIVASKELVIDNYKKEVFELTTNYINIKEQLDLTKHSLQMANDALNSITSEGINDSSDYE